MRATATPVTRDERACLRALVSKQLVPMVILLVAGTLILRKAAQLDFGAILAEVHAISSWQWTVATFAAAVSFLAIGRMDAVVHRLLGTGIGSRAAQLSGVASVATAQIVGFGLLTGTLARWRVLSGVSLWDAARITGAVSVSFMVALGALTAAMVLLTGIDLPLAQPVAALGLLAVLGMVAATVWRPRWLMRVNLPPLKAQAAIVGLALLDTAAAALALYVLIPEAHVPAPMMFYAVFLLALGAGLLGTTPGGVGPFELLLLGCFAQTPQEPLLAAIMGYRLVYFALPAGLAAVVLVAGPWLGLNRRESDDEPTARIEPAGNRAGRPVAATALSFNAPRAEAGLIRQGEFDLLVDARGHAVSLVAPSGQSLIMFADPLAPAHCAHETLRSLQQAAQRQFLTPCLYKCNARTAVAARAAGWRLLRVSHEAVVIPAAHDITRPACRQLRRQLRKAEAAGVTVAEAGPRPPLEEMREVAASWERRRRGNRGFSMGRFEDGYVAGQRLYLAHAGGRLVGFVSFHENWRERALDLMCQAEDAPTGTAHALIHHAIEAARADGCPRVSLAAVSCLAETLPLPEAAAQWLREATGAAGLARFKASFAPRWEPLYMAAPSLPALALSSIDLVDRITRPRAELAPAS